jgi:uncharacterized protein YdiU (UPF0061 family)
MRWPTAGPDAPRRPRRDRRDLRRKRVPEGAEPIAQVYAGHQFGGWVPQLGDGRAVLLGEVVAPDGARFDIQLKGAGRTPYSRMGDGRAWLGPVLREYIVSEAMAALNIPTTRALAAVTTGEIVLREGRMPGAVFARVASSHIRVGTFQYFAARQDVEALKALTDHAIARHYPGRRRASGPAERRHRRAGRAGGAMDGRGLHPWRDEHRQHDDLGRDDRLWALRLPRRLSPADGVLLHRPLRALRLRKPAADRGLEPRAAGHGASAAHADRDAAIEEFTEAVNGFAGLFDDAWHRVLRAKLGLATEEEGDAALAFDLLERMAKGEADFTNTFRALVGR